MKFILILTEGITDNDVVQSLEFTQTLVLSKIVSKSVSQQMNVHQEWKQITESFRIAY